MQKFKISLQTECLKAYDSQKTSLLLRQPQQSERRYFFLVQEYKKEGAK